MKILENLSSPKDVKNLSVEELETLSKELREEIISVVKSNGGHLSSNLGIVELTLALYYVFDFPTDKLIFDVGHQCYAHKILSGRKDEFYSIRTCGGISGFPDREESEYDAYTTGHAGASVGASLGYCVARDKLNENYFVVNVVGDGSFVNGLNLEAFTASNSKPLKYVTILNDNGMSISKNKNGLYRFISKKTVGKKYLKKKSTFKKVFGDSFITRGLKKFRSFIKRILNGKSYIESFGFKYVGIEDGNDIKRLVKILSAVKDTAEQKAIFLHIRTTKGKGLDFAEEHADTYHGVGKDLSVSSGVFATALGESLKALIKEDQKITAITAGMRDGTGLSVIKEEFPQNFIDVGIAEEYAVTLSAGMASGGLRPIVCIYSTFMQRAYDQILSDVCLQNLPVIFCLDRSGLVGEDGKTHQGVFDISFLTQMPNLTLLAPASAKEIEPALRYALSLNSPVAIRYPKSSDFCEEIINEFVSNEWKIVYNGGGEKVVLAVGPVCLELALKASNIVKDLIVVSVGTVKPLDENTLNALTGKKIVTIEENAVMGGFGSMVSAFYSQDTKTTVKIMGVPDEFIRHAKREEQLKSVGITLEELLKNLE